MAKLHCQSMKQICAVEQGTWDWDTGVDLGSLKGNCLEALLDIMETVAVRACLDQCKGIETTMTISYGR